MAANASAANLVYADLETATSSPKELSAVFSTSKVPLQRLVCARALSLETDDDALNTALRLSKDVEWSVREAVAQRLPLLHGSDEKNMEKAVNCLIGLCRDQKAEVRLAAAISLAQIPHKSRLATFISLARDKDHRMRCAGAECLGRMVGQLSEPSITTFVLPELVAMTRDDLNFSVRKTAGRALARLCQDGEQSTTPAVLNFWKLPCAETLLVLTQDAAWPCRRAAADSLPFVCGTKKHDPNIAAQLVVLSEQDTSKWVRAAALRSLGHFIALSRLDPCADILRAYSRLAVNSDDDLRFACAFYMPGVLLSVPEQAAPRWESNVREAFMNLSGDVSFKVRRTLAHSLHHVANALGPEIAANDLLPAFQSFLQDMDDEEEIKLGAVRSASKFIATLPPAKRSEAFAVLEATREEISAVPAVSLATSRDARFALASQLVAFASITPPLAGVEMLCAVLMKDEAHFIREKALDALGEVAPFLASASCLASELERMFASSHYWDRWAFARGAVSIMNAGDKARNAFASIKLAEKLAVLKKDSVVAVRDEALRAPV